RPDRPPAPRQRGTGHHAVRDRAQHARDHEHGAEHLLPGPRRTAGPRHARGNPERPERHRRLSWSALIMAEQNSSNESAGDAAKRRSTGYHMGSVDAVISVEEVTKQAKAMAVDVPLETVAALAKNNPFVNLKDLRCGYGKMEIIHGL